MTHLTVTRDLLILCTDQNIPRFGILKGVRYQDFTHHINCQGK